MHLLFTFLQSTILYDVLSVFIVVLRYKCFLKPYLILMRAVLSILVLRPVTGHLPPRRRGTGG